MTRTLLIVEKIFSKHEFHNFHKTTTNNNFDKDFVRLSPYSHSPPSRVQDHTYFVTPNHVLSVLDDLILIS